MAMPAARTVSPCQVPGCDQATVGRGWCRLHYQRWRATGDRGPLGPYPRARDLECTIDECDRSQASRGHPLRRSSGGRPGHSGNRGALNPRVEVEGHLWTGARGVDNGPRPAHAPGSRQARLVFDLSLRTAAHMSEQAAKRLHTNCIKGCTVAASRLRWCPGGDGDVDDDSRAEEAVEWYLVEERRVLDHMSRNVDMGGRVHDRRDLLGEHT